MHWQNLMWLITVATMFGLFPFLDAGAADLELSSYEDVKLPEPRRIATRQSRGASSDNFLKPQADEGSSLTKLRADALFSKIKKLNGTVEEYKKHTSQAIKKHKEDMMETIRNQSEQISSLMLKMKDGKTKNAEYVCGETRKEKLLKYFNSVTGSKTIAGLFFNYHEDINKSLESIRSSIGVLPGIIATRMPIHSANETYLQSFINRTISLWNEGYLVHIVWDIYQNPLSSKPILETGSESEWNDLIQRGGILNNVLKKELDILAPYLKQLQNAGVVPMVDILPLNNWKLNLLSGRPGSRGTLKLYQITLDYLKRRHGLNSLIWVWSVHSGAGNNMKFEDYWPGKDYVDIASVYMRTTNEKDSITVYQNLLNVVGEVPISMESMEIIPSPDLLAKQSEWAWFTILNDFVNDGQRNSLEKINATFHLESVINRSNNDFFLTSLN